MPPLNHSIVPLHIPLQIRGQIGQLLDNLKQLKPDARMRDLVKFGGLQTSRLPVPQGYTKACHTGLLGMCPFNDHTCKFKRVQQQDLTADFVHSFC